MIRVVRRTHKLNYWRMYGYVPLSEAPEYVDTGERIPIVLKDATQPRTGRQPGRRS